MTRDDASGRLYIDGVLVEDRAYQPVAYVPPNVRRGPRGRKSDFGDDED